MTARYHARYIAAQRTQSRPLAASEFDGALDEIADDLSRIAAEGRPLPSTVELFEGDADAAESIPVACGILTPRKGCCSGWEISWSEPNGDEPISTMSL